MIITDLLEKLATIKNGKYRSKIDGSYITRVGMEENEQFLLKYGITEQLQNHLNVAAHTSDIGFNPVEQKWYGWSHRALFGFGTGSTCEKGDCHYRAANLEDEIEDAIRFWSDDNHAETTAEVDDSNIKVSWVYNNKVPNESLRGTIGGVDWNYDPNNYGKGEWTAKTLEEAREMACDFAEGVS